MIKIALADDHLLFREALAEMVNRFDDCQVVMRALNGKELMDCIARDGAPDLIILDIGMPKMDGYATAKWLHKHHPDARIIVLTMLDSEMMIVQQLRAGARGFVKKDASPGEFETAINMVMAGGLYFSPEVMKNLLDQTQLNSLMTSTIVSKDLNEREIEFVRLTCSDYTYKEIAERMNLGVRVVDHLREDLFERLGIRSRVGLAIFALRQGLVAI